AVTFDPRFEKYFHLHLGDPDQNICIEAMLGIGLLELEYEAPNLVPYFRDEELRQNALPAYAMCASFEPSRAGLRRLFQKIDRLAAGATWTIPACWRTRAWTRCSSPPPIISTVRCCSPHWPRARTCTWKNPCRTRFSKAGR